MTVPTISPLPCWRWCPRKKAGGAFIAEVAGAPSAASGARTVTGSSYAAGFTDLTSAGFGFSTTYGGPALLFRAA